MKIIIFGSTGMLGTYVTKYLSGFYDTIPLTRSDIDLMNLTMCDLREVLLKNTCDSTGIIINCAGVIPQSEKQHKLNNKHYYKINTVFPIILGTLCSEIGCKFLHITTDCVFSGNEGNYNEDSDHNESNDYGTSKSLGELCGGTIIRTSIIGEELLNKQSLLEWMRSNKNNIVNGFVNHFWNGVTCLQLAKIIKSIINENMYWEGIRHIFSPTFVSKYELVVMINDIYDLNITINKFEAERNINKCLISKYEILFDIPNIYNQLEEQKEFSLI